DEIFTGLAEDVGGEGLERFARRVVPSLVAERRERWAAELPPVLGGSSATSVQSTARLPPRRSGLVRALVFASAALAIILVAAVALAVGVAFQERRQSPE